MNHLTFILFVAALIASFVMLKIMPTFETIYDDFELPLPLSTEACANFLGVAGDFFLLILLLCLCLFLWLRFGDPLRRLRRSFLSRTFGRFVDFETPHLLQRLARWQRWLAATTSRGCAESFSVFGTPCSKTATPGLRCSSKV